MKIEENRKKPTCSNCGAKMNELLERTNKCEKCYEKEARVFVWVVIGMAIFLVLVVLIRYLIGGKV